MQKGSIAHRRARRIVVLASLASSAGCGVAKAENTTLTFEGLGDYGYVGSYYSSNYGLSFYEMGTGVASTAGGSFAWENMPSPNTAAYNSYVPGTSPSASYNATLNAPYGISSFSTYYTYPYNDSASIQVYSGVNGTGTLMGSLTLTNTPGGSTSQDPYDIWYQATPSFSGIAHSVVFIDSSGYVGWDNMSMNLTREADWNSAYTSGYWNSGGYWTGGAAPDSVDSAVFNGGGSYESQLTADATAGGITIGNDNLTLNLAGHTLTSRGDVIIGNTAGGTLTVGGGSLVASGNSSIHVGNAAGYSNVLTVNSGSVSAGYDLSVGDYSVGTVNQSGGAVAVGHILYVGADSGTDTYNLQGGTVTAPTAYLGYGGGNNANAVTISAGSTLGVSDQTKVFNTPSRINLAGGTLRTGSLVLASSSNLNWTAGTLLINGNGSDVGPYLGVPAGGTLGGNGTLASTTFIALASPNGHLAPGDPSVNGGIGTFSVGSTTLGASGQLANLDIDLASASSADLVDITGTFTLTDAQLNLALAPG